MKKLLFIVMLAVSAPTLAESLKGTINAIESEWASIYYGAPKAKQAAAYRLLLEKTVKLSRQYPDSADVLYWEAVLKANYAEHQSELAALDAIHEVRDLLNKVISINPKTMGGSAYVVLGTLYFMAPPWPIAFGDNEEADKLLQTALKINPDGIDSNYFYGKFLLSKERVKEAERYFSRASSAPVRPEQAYADNELKKEAKTALENSQRQHDNSKTVLSSLFAANIK